MGGFPVLSKREVPIDSGFPILLKMEGSIDSQVTPPAKLVVSSCVWGLSS